MSALPPKADMVEHGCDVRFVPKADTPRCGKKRRYFDHLASRARIEHIGPQVVAREEQKLLVDWVW